MEFKDDNLFNLLGMFYYTIEFYKLGHMDKIKVHLLVAM